MQTKEQMIKEILIDSNETKQIEEWIGKKIGELIFDSEKNDWDIDTSELISTVDSVKGTSNGVSFEDMLEKDYNDGNLTTDEYIMQLAYSIYDSSKIKSDFESSA